MQQTGEDQSLFGTQFSKSDPSTELLNPIRSLEEEDLWLYKNFNENQNFQQLPKAPCLHTSSGLHTESGEHRDEKRADSFPSSQSNQSSVMLNS